MKVTQGLPFLSLLFLCACGGGGDGDNPSPEPEPESQPPTAATLVFPDNNEVCTEGDPVNDGLSRITFLWNASQNTDTYQLVLRNLDTGFENRYTSETNEVTVGVERAAPFEWFVVSRAAGVSQTASSATWRFFNEGPGLENYAPFPATVVAPPRGAYVDATANFLLRWEAADADDDITGFEVFLGTNAETLPSVGTTAVPEFEIEIEAGTLYYWQIRTVDAAGNSSLSERFEFQVNP